jgi:hypothetical protein
MPKMVKQNGDGTLWLRYWPGAEKLRTRAIKTPFPDLQESQDRAVLGQWRLQGDSLSGSASTPFSSVFAEGIVEDFDLSCEVIPDCARAAVLFRSDPKEGQGLTLTLDYELDRIEVGPLMPSYIGGLRPGVWDAVSGVLPDRAQPLTLRVLARAEFAEIYLGDRWLFTVVTAESEWPPHTGTTAAPLSGQLGFAVEGGSVTFRNLEVYHLEPLIP